MNSAVSTLAPEHIRRALGPRLQPLDGRAHPIQAYLQLYGLDALRAEADYRVGCLPLAGGELVVQQFLPPLAQQQSPHALLVHGYMDHAALNRNLIRHLRQRGWGVTVYDLPGHGLSAGEPLSVESFFHYSDQLAALIERLQRPGGPALQLIGHSTGAAILTTLLIRHPELRAALQPQPVLLAPLLRPSHWRMIRRKYRWLRYLLRRVRRLAQDNSHDADYLRFLRRQDPLQHDYIPVQWVGAMLSWIDWIEQQAPIVWSPLIIQGTEDRTVDWRGNLPVFERLYRAPEIVLIDAARHSLVNEALPWREQVFAALDRVLMAGPTPAADTARPPAGGLDQERR